MKIRRIIFLLKVFCLLLIAYHLFLTKVYAQGDFRTDYNTEYSVNPKGVTIVTQYVVLTNLKTNIYAREYTITLDTENIQNVIAFDSGGTLDPQVSQKDGKTYIKLNFNEKIVGLGKKLSFTLRYENNEIASRNGSIWEINIPGIAGSDDLGVYDVTLQTPPNFGENAYMVPLPEASNKWTKNQMVRGGISAAYGTEQFFTVKLVYYLDNPNSTNKLTEIAIPPDTAYQKVSINKLEPSPLNIYRDDDGNWMAKYELLPKTEMKIDADIVVSVKLKPRSTYGREPIIINNYLLPTKYWNSKDMKIAKLAEIYNTPRKIYDYVVETLSYDYDRVNENAVRKGSTRALINPQNSVCMEFTDVFVAVARAAGIPARQVVGYAYTTNKKLRPLSLVTDVMHAWPEYYDESLGLWIPVDPTWGDTTGGVNYFDKLDFNHIVFAINGKQDDYPYPAGSYKDSEKKGKNITVNFADEAEAKHLKASLVTRIDFPGNIISGFSAGGQVEVKNNTGVGIDDISVIVRSDPQGTSVQKTLDHIPPFTSKFIPFTFSTGSYFSDGKASIKAVINSEMSSVEFNIRPLYLLVLTIVAFTAAIAAVIWMILKKFSKLPPITGKKS